MKDYIDQLLSMFDDFDSKGYLLLGAIALLGLGLYIVVKIL